MSQPRRLDCAETWAGNEGAASLVELPGLVAWVHSIPAGADVAGGDVHYVSVCPSCIVSRIVLADVSGHGRAVVALSGKLRTLMEKYLTALEQTGLMRDLNSAVQTELDGVHYATMVAVGFHGDEVCSYSVTRVTRRHSGIVQSEMNGRGSKRTPRDIPLV